MIQQGCNYPGCSRIATASWATVPVCIVCYVEIMEETRKYYKDASKRINHHLKTQRTYYEGIRPLTPWRRKNIESYD